MNAAATANTNPATSNQRRCSQRWPTDGTPCSSPTAVVTSRSRIHHVNELGHAHAHHLLTGLVDNTEPRRVPVSRAVLSGWRVSLLLSARVLRTNGGGFPGAGIRLAAAGDRGAGGTVDGNAGLDLPARLRADESAGPG